MYVAIERKPENGCEIQNAACARSGIMLNLKVVTTAQHQRESDTGEEGTLTHGTVVLKRLVAPWAGTKRIIFADSYFASATTPLELLKMGLRFIGVVKTATHGFPMGALSVIPLDARGQHASFTHANADGVTDMMAVLWVDRERRYFIASTSTSLPGAPCQRVRWRQMSTEAARVALTVEQPQVAEVYYRGCASIDRQNRCLQDDLKLEHKYVTQDWSKRVNLSLLGICFVDAWMLYSGAQATAATLTQAEFYENLAEQLIDNTYDSVGAGRRGLPAVGEPEDAPAPLRFGVGVHLTPTLKRRREALAETTDRCAQRTCRVCKHKRTTSVCSRCRAASVGEVFCCGPRTGRNCFDVHMREVHQLDV